MKQKSHVSPKKFQVTTSKFSKLHGFISLRKLIIIAVVILAIALGWYFTHNRNQPKLVSTTTVTRGDLSQTLILSGEVAAREHVKLQFQSAGMLSWVGIKEGDTVSKNQALASLDKNALKKSLQQKLNNYLTTRWNFEQTQDDHRDWEVASMSDEEREAIKRIVDKSQFGLNNAVLDVELQDLALKFATLTTPIAGRVIQAEPAYAGVNITPASSVYEIINPATLYFAITADQTEVVNLQQNQQATITLDSFPDHPINGQITYVSYTPDPTESGTVYEIRVESSDFAANSQIRLGMTGDADLIMAHEPGVLMLPNEYIQTDTDGKTYVWTSEAGQKTNIEVGMEGDDATQIVSGLTQDQVVYLLEQ